MARAHTSSGGCRSARAVGRGEKTLREESNVQLGGGCGDGRGVLPVSNSRESGSGKLFPTSAGPLAVAERKADLLPCGGEKSEPQKLPKGDNPLGHRRLWPNQASGPSIEKNKFEERKYLGKATWSGTG